MKQQDILRKAQKYLRIRQYDKVINFLEPQIFKYRKTAAFFHILGLAYLQAGDISGANSFLNRALQLEPENEDVLLAIAAMHLRREEVDKAVKCWLSVLELNYRNRYAQRALEMIRKQTPGRDFFDMSNITKFLPQQRINYNLVRIALYASAAAVLLAGITAIIFLTINREPKLSREGSELLIIEDQSLLRNETVGKPLIEFDEASLQAIFQTMQEDFEAGKDHLVQYNINRVMYSNASAPLKSKAEALEAYLQKASFITLQDSFSYTEVVTSPRLYDKVFVRWQGKVANKTFMPDGSKVFLDLLIGYHESQVLEGIIRAEIDFPVLVENSDAVEVIGFIDHDPANTPPLLLVVTDLRKIITEKE